MIDEQRKNDLRDALTTVCSDEEIDNLAENLRLENVPLCGKRAIELPYYDAKLDRG